MFLQFPILGAGGGHWNHAVAAVSVDLLLPLLQLLLIHHHTGGKSCDETRAKSTIFLSNTLGTFNVYECIVY